MDFFLKNQREAKYAGEYRRIVTKLFLAQRFCLGFPQVISLFDWSVRILVCYYAARQVSSSSGVIRNGLLEQDWWLLSRDIATATASHAYGLLKGYH